MHRTEFNAPDWREQVSSRQLNMIGEIGWDDKLGRVKLGFVNSQGEPISTPKKHASPDTTPSKSNGRRKKRKRSVEIDSTCIVEDTKSDTQSPPRKKSWIQRSPRNYSKVTPNRRSQYSALARSRRDLQDDVGFESVGGVGDNDYSTATNVTIDKSPLTQTSIEKELRSLQNENTEHIKALKDLSQGLAELEESYNNSKKITKEKENEIITLRQEKRQCESQLHNLLQHIQKLSEHSAVLTKQTRTTG